MLDASREAIDNLKEDYPGAFRGWDESKVRMTMDETEDGEKGRILMLTILFQLHGEKQQKHRKSSGTKVYKVHKVLLTDVRTEATKVGDEELISEFYTLVDSETQ